MLAPEVFVSNVELKYEIIIGAAEATGQGIYNFAMLFLSLDRMLTATFGAGYTDIWNKAKTSVLVAVKWLAMLLIGSSFCVHIYMANELSLAKQSFRVLFLL